jgi:hypothetical protein
MILIDPPIRPVTTTWACALMIMSAGFFAIPITAMLILGVLPRVEGNIVIAAVELAALGGVLLVAARGSWRGARWPLSVLLLVIAVEVGGLALGDGYAWLALALLVPAALLLRRPSAKAFSARASAADLKSAGIARRPKVLT